MDPYFNTGGCELPPASVQTSTSNQIHDAARQRWDLAWPTLRGAVDARRGRGQSRAGAHAETAKRRAAIHARTPSPNKAGATVTGASMLRVSNGPCLPVQARVHWRSERNLCISPLEFTGLNSPELRILRSGPCLVPKSFFIFWYCSTFFCL